MSAHPASIIRATGTSPMTAADYVRLLVRIEAAFLGLLYFFLSLCLDVILYYITIPSPAPIAFMLEAEAPCIYAEEELSEETKLCGDKDADNSDAEISPPVPVSKLTPSVIGLIAAKPPRRTGDTIPIDIYLLIISLLAKRDRITLLRVCRYTHLIIAPIIYPILYTTVHIDLFKDINPIAICGVPTSPRRFSVPIEDVVLTSMVDQNGVRTTIRKVITHDPLPNRFEYTTFLTLTSHSRSACGSAPLDMPNLDTLRVEPRAHVEDLYLCWCSSSLQAPTTSEICPLVAALRPRRVILGTPSTGLGGSAEGLWPPAPPFTPYPCPPPYVKELVVLLGFFCARDNSPVPCAPFLQHLPASLDKVTFVIGCYEETYDEVDRRGDRVLNAGLPAWWDIDLVAWRMYLACVGDAKVIEVVSQAADIGEDMGDLERELVRRGWDVGKAKARAQAVRVESEGVFAGREGWYRELREAPKEALVAKIKREIQAEAAQPRAHRQWCSCGVCSPYEE